MKNPFSKLSRQQRSDLIHLVVVAVATFVGTFKGLLPQLVDQVVKAPTLSAKVALVGTALVTALVAVYKVCRVPAKKLAASVAGSVSSYFTRGSQLQKLQAQLGTQQQLIVELQAARAAEKLAESKAVGQTGQTGQTVGYVSPPDAASEVRSHASATV